MDSAYYRGEHARFHPRDEDRGRADFLHGFFVEGLAPPRPILDREASVVAFGSCFASHITRYLVALGFNVAAKKFKGSYVNTMGDGMVNTHAIRQQFEWAWLGRQPKVELWRGYDGAILGYTRQVRQDTRAMFDSADVFIITLGLSEVWYDEPTGEVFWRAVPREHLDPSRHKFRTVGFGENLENIRTIHRLIREHRPQAAIIFTLSPIPLVATFRPIPCTVADSASKSVLRAALDEFFQAAQPGDDNLFYFPSYEIALQAFEHPFRGDRRHVHRHVLDLNMAVFERYFCDTGLTDEQLARQYRYALRMDRRVMLRGSKSVPLKGGPERAVRWRTASTPLARLRLEAGQLAADAAGLADGLLKGARTLVGRSQRGDGPEQA